MLHMIVSTHGPETCPAAHPELPEKAQASMQKMDEVAAKLGIKMQGGWASHGAHTSFVLVDAPDAHAVNQMGAELGLLEWSTATIYPVVTLQEAMEAMQQQ